MRGRVDDRVEPVAVGLVAVERVVLERRNDTLALDAVEEMLNWFALLGAVETLGARLAWSQWVESYIFNSNKVFAVYGST
jgi:hypothetical protein